MGIPAGCEIVAHYIRGQLESDNSLGVAKVDMKNAFNEIDPAAILNVISAQLPSVFPLESLRRPRLKLEFERPSGGEKSEFDSNSLKPEKVVCASNLNLITS